MKKFVTDTMLMPTYVSRFSCIGGDCEDTCCAGWGVTLDKESFLQYQSSFDPVLRPLFSRHVKRYAASKSDLDYGHIELQGDACRSCSMLSETKLCRIQERLGEAALSNTCAYYPRTIHRFGDLHQMVLSLSCPEAARLALLAEDAFDLQGEERTAPLDYITEVKPSGGLSVEAMEDVRTLLFQILRSPDATLSDRLKLIGRSCDRLTDLISQQRTGELPALLLSIEEDLDSGAAMAPLAVQGEHTNLQAEVAAGLFLAAWKATELPHVRQVLGEAALGLGIREGEPVDDHALVRAYQEGLRRLGPALETVPWLLEHYFLNEALREVFPWGQESPRQHFTSLVIRFALLRLLLAGRAAARETPLTPAELAETIQVACRRYQHDVNFTKYALQSLALSGWDSLERLQALL